MALPVRFAGFLGFFHFCLFVLGWFAPAVGQVLDAEIDADSLESEVVVFARRRAEISWQTPLSVTAIDSREIAARSASEISFIEEAIPNVSFDVGTVGIASSAVPAVYIRGVGQDDYLSTTDPGVGVYLDGVYLGRMVGQNLRGIDVEQIEVLRGPQGTLYGRNTIGGAINVRLRKPSHDLGAFLRASFGSDSLADLEARFDLPISKRAWSAWTINVRRREGFAQSPNSPGIDFGNDNSALIRGQLSWEPAPALQVDISADWTRQREESEPVIIYGSEFENPNTLVGFYNSFAPLLGRKLIMRRDIVSLARSDRISLTGPSRDDLDIWGMSAKVRWNLSERTSLRAISAFRGLSANVENDQDSLPPLAALFDFRLKQRQFSQEFQVEIKTRTLDLVGGFHFFKEESRDDARLYLVPGLFGAIENLQGAVIPVAEIPTDENDRPLFFCPATLPGFPCAGGFGNPINIALDQTIRLFGDLDVENVAGFAHASIETSERLALSIGARLTNESKRFFAFQSKIESSEALGSVFYNLSPQKLSARWTSFTPHLGASYRFPGDFLAYISFNRGFRSGTFNGRANNQLTFGSVRPETLNAFEAGIKGISSTPKIRFSFAAFHNDYKDLQVRAVVPASTGLNVFFVNAAKARISGFEAEAKIHPAKSVNFGGTLGFASSTITKVDAAISAATGIVAGNDLPKTPRWNGSFFSEIRFDLPIGRVTLRSDMSWRSGVFHDPANKSVENVGTTRESGYAIVNVRATILTSDRTTELSVWAKNIANQQRYSSLLSNAGGLFAAYPVRGREWGLSIRKSL